MRTAKQQKQEVVDSAMKIAEDVAKGKLDPNAIEAEVVAKCRELFATVYGPHDPLWELHRDITRQFLHMGGMPADELSEWTVVQRSREEAKPEPSWIEQALADGADEDQDAE